MRIFDRISYAARMGLMSRARMVFRAAQMQQPPVLAENKQLALTGRNAGPWSAAGPWSLGGVYGGVTADGIAPRVSRAEALQVPAVTKGRNLIVGAISSLPLVTLDSAQQRVTPRLFRQIDPGLANVVTLAATVEDLLFEGVAWWKILSFEWDGFPASAEHVAASRVSVLNGVTYVDGVRVDQSQVIRFDSPNPALLVHSARAIRRALRFERTAEMYADDPRMLGFFSPAEGADPADDDEIVELLDSWELARRERVTGYIPASLRYNSLDLMSPADLKLPELQQRAALDIANAMGIDPEDLGVSTTSRTYANVSDRRQDLINQTLSPFMLAITGRLSMNDVTKRSQMVRFDLENFMKADPLTRASVDRTYVELGVLSVESIRAREGYPASTAPPVQPAAELPAISDRVENAVPAIGVIGFSAREPETFTFASTTFKVSAAKRTVEGLLLPFGQVGHNARGSWRFAPGSVEWNRAAVSRVKLNREHDRDQLLGAATEIGETEFGLSAAFKVARGAAGEQAIGEAEDEILDGLSAELEIIDYTIDPVDSSVFLVTKARLTGAAMTATPAFDDARLTGVYSKGVSTMPCSVCGQMHAAGIACSAAPASAPNVEAFTAAVVAFTDAVTRLGSVPPEHREVVPVRASVREPLTYSLDGRGHSFVKDAWEVKRGSYGSTATADAFARLKKYEEQSQELSKQAFNARIDAQFANAGNTTDQAGLIQQGYRPDLYVGQIPQGRPLFDAMSRGNINDATPFRIPVWVGSSGLNGDNTEGTGPSSGTITNHTYRTVTPKAQSGEFVITRELVDSANPAIDQIALAAMREEYSQDTEGVIATALAAATDDNTDGVSTEGSYVYSLTGDGRDLAQQLRQIEGEFPFHRYTVAPDRILLSARAFGGLTAANDDSGRPLFPFVGASNAMGTAGRAAQSLSIDGLDGVPAWALTQGTNDVMMFNHVDAWAWESPLLQFRFEEKQGPENIVLNIWAYFAFQILRYPGLHSVGFTRTI